MDRWGQQRVETDVFFITPCVIIIITIVVVVVVVFQPTALWEKWPESCKDIPAISKRLSHLSVSVIKHHRHSL